MFPRLIDFGVQFRGSDLFVPTYGLLFAGGALLAWWWFVRRGREQGVPEDQLFNLSFYTLLAGILGAKLTLIVVDWDLYVNHPKLLLGTLRSAGVVIGGIVAGSLAFTFYTLKNRLPLHRLGDAIAAPLALAQGLGRVGCFCAGCCWGKPAAEGAGLAVTFTDPHAAAQTGVPLGIPLVPTQLFHMVGNFALAGLLTWLYRRRIQPDGTVFWIYVLLYSAIRGVIEFWRGDAQRGLFFGDAVSTSQLLSLGGIVLGGAMLLHSFLRRPASDRVRG